MSERKEQYEKLRAAVYSVIYPDGIPLEEGVQVVDAHDNILLLGYKDNKTMKIVGAYFDLKDIKTLKRYYKILGKPLSLRSLLRAIGDDNQPTQLNTNGVMTVFKADKDGKTPICDYQITIDFYKSIKEQDPETLDKLYKLIKK